jgi:hypothetical protein
VIRPSPRAAHAGTVVGVLVGALVVLGACTSETRSRVTDVLRPAHRACRGEITRSNVGPLTDPALQELSGIATSTRNPGVLWVHNDSGDSARVFAIGPNGTTRGTYTLAGAKAVDWEDIARGPGSGPDRSSLFVGDIGDNGAARPEITVYRVPEPEVDDDAGAVTLEGVDALHLRYPDGAHDAEALLVDPKSGEVFIITKNLGGGPVGIYRAPAVLDAGTTTTLERVGTLSLPAGLSNAVTGADISPDGSKLAVRTYGSVLLWDRKAGTSIGTALEGTPCRGPIPLEIQGEAVGFRADDGGYVTVSEGANPTLHEFRFH